MRKNSYLAVYLIIAVSTVLVHVGITQFGEAAVFKPSPFPKLVADTLEAKPKTDLPKPPCPTNTATTTTTTTGKTTTITTVANDPVVCRSLKFYGITAVIGHGSQGVANINVGALNLNALIQNLSSISSSRFYLTKAQTGTMGWAAFKSQIYSMLSVVPSAKSVEVWAVFQCDECLKKNMSGWQSGRQAFRISAPVYGAYSWSTDIYAWKPDYLTASTSQYIIQAQFDAQVKKLLQSLCSSA